MARHLPPDAKPKLAYEGVDVNPRSITRAAIVLFGITAVSALLTLGLFRLLASFERRRDPPPPPMAQQDPNRLPPAPRLQSAPLADVDALRAEEAQLLGSYGWVDEEKGIARVPIEEAMKMYAARAAAPGQTTETQRHRERTGGME